jgi:hypothetical protein
MEPIGIRRGRRLSASGTLKEPLINSGIVELPGRRASVEAKNAGIIALFQFFSEERGRYALQDGDGGVNRRFLNLNRPPQRLRLKIFNLMITK